MCRVPHSPESLASLPSSSRRRSVVGKSAVTVVDVVRVDTTGLQTEPQLAFEIPLGVREVGDRNRHVVEDEVHVRWGSGVHACCGVVRRHGGSERQEDNRERCYDRLVFGMGAMRPGETESIFPPTRYGHERPVSLPSGPRSWCLAL